MVLDKTKREWLGFASSHTNTIGICRSRTVGEFILCLSHAFVVEPYE